MKRHFVSVGERLVHIRYAGSGPPLLLLHGSPNTGAIFEPFMEKLSEHYLVIAPDTPGNGESDALTEKADDATAHADAIIGLLDALSIRRLSVYGFHTGATFAAELAIRNRERISALVLDGYPNWTESEAQRLDDTYLAPVGAEPDGAHLASLWSRVIEQSWHFPWHQQNNVHWLQQDLGNTQALHERAMELLRARATYALPYAAALRADGNKRLLQISVPTLMIAAAHDPLCTHLSRTPPNPHITRAVEADSALVQQRVMRHLAQQPKAVAADLHLRQAATHYLTIGGYQVLSRGTGQTLHLHNVGGSSRAGSGLRIDLPGHGLTDLPFPEQIEDAREIVQEIAKKLGAERLAGDGLGDVLASDQAATPLAIATPKVAPRWDGAHLLAAWHYVRFRRRYERWDDRHPAKLVRSPLPSAEALTDEVLNVLQAGEETLRRTLPYSLVSALNSR